MIDEKIEETSFVTLDKLSGLFLGATCVVFYEIFWREDGTENFVC